MVVIWTEFAAQDLHNIFNYIAETSHYYAHIVRASFLKTAKNLNQFPESGRIIPEKGIKGYREKFVYSYRLIYRISGRKIYIVALVHMRQNLEALRDLS